MGLALAALLAAAIALLLSSGLGRASRSTQPAKAFAAHLNAGASGLAAARSLRSLPVSAQATISRTLGAHQQKFLAQSAGLGYRMAAGGVRADFAPSGVRLDAAGRSVSVRLAGIGHGADLRPLAAVAPRARANLVRYEGGSVDSWYAGGPLGIEQGFTLARRPSGSEGPLTLELALSGGLSARAADHGRGLVFSGTGGRVALRYGGLSARDARGHALAAWLQLEGSRLLIHVADRGARYPLRIDPLVQAAKLTASGAVENDLLGWSVAVSGNTVFAGAPWSNIGANEHQGAVYVFSEAGGGWSSETQVAKLTASDGAAYADLGESVAVSGNTVFAGAPRATIGVNEQQGAVYVFSEPGGGWSNETQAAKLTASDGVKGSRLATSLAGSGTTVVAGDPTAKVGANEGQGTAYVFTEPGGGWSNETQAAKLTASDGAASVNLGESVGVSGSTVVAGAPQAKVGENERQGAAYVFSEPGGGWSNETQTAKLTASDGASANLLGSSVAVAGATVLAGAPQAKIGTSKNEGAAYVFTEPGGGWSNEIQAAKLTASGGGAGAYFGVSLAISGGSVLVGAPDANVGPGGYKGAAYLFTEPGGGWSGERHQAETLTVSEPSGYGLGWAVGLAGTDPVASAPFYSEGPHEDAAAYVFAGEASSPSPKWYSDGEQIAQGQKVNVATSASLTLRLLQQTGEPTIKCKLKDSETVENPVGGGAGVDEVTAFTLSGCKTTSTSLCRGKLFEFTASNLPWRTHLIDGSPITDELEGIELLGSCTAPGEVVRLEGTLTPAVVGSALDFSTSSGKLGGNYGQASVTATDKLKGPKGDTKITAQEG